MSENFASKKFCEFCNDPSICQIKRPWKNDYRWLSIIRIWTWEIICPNYRDTWIIESHDNSNFEVIWHENSNYFNVRKFRVQKISRISRMTPQFAKLNGRKKNILADSRKLIPTRHSFQIFLFIFCLLEHENRLYLILPVFSSGKI